ncbi:Glucose--fructose oxidoreductase [Colletotrichum sp. SAR 10_96]|nr:Glucose--fructose oxidoreductase [Colletotrichum sp. SAR 10_96]
MVCWRVVGINFDHMHMGDLLRNAFDHPDVDIVGVCDRQADRTKDAVTALGIAPELIFTDVRECIRQTKPDLIILCPATTDHAVAYEECCSFGVDVLMEKPFAANIRDTRRMLNARDAAATRLAINWPSRWFPAHVTQVHYYGGNRGPLYHLADKVEVSDNEVQRKKSDSWWYKKESGGGSLLDYLGYGATLGTWFMDGRAPLKVTTVTSAGEGIEVDEHSITICQYTTGLSKFETRWGTFTDPWTIQPQPSCGFVVVGTEGTISSYDYDPHVGVQTKDRREVTNIPADVLQSPYRNPIEYVFHCKKNGMPVTGPLDPVLCFTAQRIIDTAVESAKQGKTLDLLG